jgi:hypothetical protein
VTSCRWGVEQALFVAFQVALATLCRQPLLKCLAGDARGGGRGHGVRQSSADGGAARARLVQGGLQKGEKRGARGKIRGPGGTGAGGAAAQKPGDPRFPVSRRAYLSRCPGEFAHRLSLRRLPQREQSLEAAGPGGTHG